MVCQMNFLISLIHLVVVLLVVVVMLLVIEELRGHFVVWKIQIRTQEILVVIVVEHAKMMVNVLLQVNAMNLDNVKKNISFVLMVHVCWLLMEVEVVVVLLVVMLLVHIVILLMMMIMVVLLLVVVQFVGHKQPDVV